MSNERVPPHSIEAEEYLLSCGFLDGAELIARCIIGKITPATFYVPSTRVVYEAMLALYHRGVPIDLQILAEELKNTRQLEGIGGYAYLTQISTRVPTTAQANYFISQVRKLHQLRTIITNATSAVERVYEYSGEDMSELVQPMEELVWKIRAIDNVESRARGIGSFEIPDEKDPATLLGDRYICRGHACLIVGGSGMGKSTIAYQASIAWALGRPFLGIAVTNEKGWLSSVHFQSEDEDGDIAEVRECVFQEMKLTAEERALVNERVTVITEKVLRGDAFIADMAVTATRLNADLVWLNPLHAFMKGDIKDAEAVGDFCRGGLNAANRDSKWAYMIVHHTPKPTRPQGNADPKEREWNEVMYEGAGSADLVNFCRAVQVLKATKTEGDFNLYLAKRGKKADVRIEKESETGTQYIELVTKVPCRHSRNKITLPGRSKPIPVMYWEGRDADKPVEKGGARTTAGRKSEHPFIDGEFLGIFPASNAEPEDATAAMKLAKQQMVGVPPATIYRHKARLVTDGFLQPFPDNGMRRTHKGDVCVTEYLSKRP